MVLLYLISDTPAQYLLFSLLGFLFCFRFCFSSMCYTGVCNALAINVQCYLMPNKMYVMLCYIYVYGVSEIRSNKTIPVFRTDN